MYMYTEWMTKYCRHVFKPDVNPPNLMYSVYALVHSVLSAVVQAEGQNLMVHNGLA